MVDDQGAWVAAGVSAGEPVLVPSDGRWVATIADNVPVVSGTMWVELEIESRGADRTWRLRLWADGSPRPDAPIATVSEPRPEGPGEMFVGAWMAGDARVADLTALALEASRSVAPAVGAAWPVDLDGDTVDLTLAGHEARSLSLRALDAVEPAAKAASAGPSLKTGLSFSCNPYRYHFTGYAPGLPGSSALLHLPPVDNDCDGAFNEDPVNWHDDDGDGLVDEDSAWWGDDLLNWTSSDSRLGDLATGDTGALILSVRHCWPTRIYLVFATVTGDAVVVTGGVRVVPEGGGLAVVAHDWHAAEYLLTPATSTPLTVSINETGAPLVDGVWLQRPAVLTFPTTGGSGSVTLDATVDGVAYAPGASYDTEGWHTVHVVATDGAGATATADASFGVDLSPPAFADLDPASGSVIDVSPVVVTGQVSEDTVEVLVGGVAATLGAPAGGMRPFTSAAITLVEGPQVVVLVATDGVGRTTTVELVLDLDSLAPQLVIDSPADGALFPAGPVTVTGTVTETHLASLMVNGVAATLDGARFTAEIPLVEGDNALEAIATDGFGRTGVATVAVTLDTTAPDISLVSPTDGAVVDASPITVTGHVEDPYLAAVEVNGVTATVTDTVFTAEGVVLSEGVTTIVASASDSVGNSASAPTRIVILDTLAPELTVDATGLPSLTAAATLALSGTAVDPHLASVTVNGVAATLAGDAWSIAAIPLAEGDNTLVVRAEDSLGHLAEAPAITVVRDSLAPVLVITEPADGAALSSADLIVRGTVTDPHLDPASVVVNGLPATVSGDTFEISLTLDEGDTTLTAEASDTLGQTGTSAAVTVTVDTLPPVVSLTEPLKPVVGTPTVAVLGTVHVSVPGVTT